jgi:UDPglucose--hexose-1-phosphate uridylyltransferase
MEHVETTRPGPGSPHRRLNPLTGEWVLVSPQRTERPWHGQIDEPAAAAALPAHDPSCYLCPGNARTGGERNPEYEGTYVFTNDFPALVLEGDGEYGTCRVVCYSPRHDLGFGELPLPAIEKIVETWTEQYAELGADPRIGHVQIFENRGPQMGASNPHPHGQIWATEHVPTIVEREQQNLARAPVLLDYLKGERDRIVEENDHFVAVVPYWANWPFETLVIARRRVPSLTELRDHEREAIGPLLKNLVRRYDGLFATPFPYSMGIHQAPTSAAEKRAGSHLHLHFYPPLLRSAGIRKFMVGYELLAEAQRDITPEEAADRLRAVRL